jgi:hypothetical protein
MSYALFVAHEDFVVNYGEVKGDAQLEFGWRVGNPVSEGQEIARVSSTEMIHFETYIPGATIAKVETGRRITQLRKPQKLDFFKRATTRPRQAHCCRSFSSTIKSIPLDFLKSSEKAPSAARKTWRISVLGRARTSSACRRSVPRSLRSSRRLRFEWFGRIGGQSTTGVPKLNRRAIKCWRRCRRLSKPLTFHSN